MTSHRPALLVDDPIHLNYSHFFHAALSMIASASHDIPGIDVFIRSKLEDSYALNISLSTIYSKIRNICTDLDFDHTFEIDVYFNSDKFESLSKNWTQVYCLQAERHLLTKWDHFAVKSIDVSSEPSSLFVPEKERDHSIPYRSYGVTAVGGTFDHLHDAHKILLSMAVFLTHSRLIIGITGPELLKNKKFKEVLESYEYRQKRVIEFIQNHVSPTMKFETFQINDVCGPTGYVKDIEALVVSYESSKGGIFVNNYRRDKGYSELDIVSIKVIGSDFGNEDNNWSGKLSSTDIREIEFKKLNSSH